MILQVTGIFWGQFQGLESPDGSDGKAMTASDTYSEASEVIEVTRVDRFISVMNFQLFIWMFPKIGETPQHGW